MNFSSIFPVAYAAIRIALANKAPITDCDEVYNYWEPVHFLHHGSGMQTWEYAPQYALRTYFYLLPMSYLSRLYDFLLQYFFSPWMIEIFKNLLSSSTLMLKPDVEFKSGAHVDIDNQNKVLVFQLMRSTLALLTALSELRLYRALTSTSSPSIKDKSKHSIGIWTLFILLTSAGMFHAGPAYLPSATAMLCWMNSASHQLSISSYTYSTDIHSRIKNRDDSHVSFAIMWGLLSVLGTGWPFCGVLFVPIGVFAICRVAWRSNDTATNGSVTKAFWRKIDIRAACKVLYQTLLHAIFIQIVVMAVDYSHYGKIISPTLNIFIYNAAGGGDELYGIEPISYYVKNLILNWNVIGLMGLASLPLGLTLRWLPFPVNTLSTESDTGRSIDMWKKILVLLPMYLWLLIVAPRPHKEERFLFPIYPMLAIGSAVFLEDMFNVVPIHTKIADWFARRGMLAKAKKDKVSTNYEMAQRIKIGLGLLCLSPAALFSISRSAALSMGYAAPLQLYGDLYNHMKRQHQRQQQRQEEIPLVCTGGEWYRYPSSFHLPNHARLAFLKSSFDGQLPQQFTEFGSKEESLVIQQQQQQSHRYGGGGRFNDLNKEDTDRYVTIQDCSYVIELVREEDDSDEPECIKYMEEDGWDKWQHVAQYEFLDAEKTSLLHRVLYLPNFHKAHFKNYVLYERKIMQ